MPDSLETMLALYDERVGVEGEGARILAQHDAEERERIARNIEAVRDVHDDGVYTGLDIAVRIVREGA